jgi:hypothetical protein
MVLALTEPWTERHRRQSAWPRLSPLDRWARYLGRGSCSTRRRGTEGSNPSPSTGESVANLTPLRSPTSGELRRVNDARPRWGPRVLITSAHAFRRAGSLPTLKTSAVPSPTTGRLSPEWGIGRAINPDEPAASLPRTGSHAAVSPALSASSRRHPARPCSAETRTRLGGAPRRPWPEVASPEPISSVFWRMRRRATMANPNISPNSAECPTPHSVGRRERWWKTPVIRGWG